MVNLGFSLSSEELAPNDLVRQMTVCWAESEQQAKRTSHHYWRNAALSWELKTPRLTADAAAHVQPDDVAEQVICGLDPARHPDQIRQYADAGFDHVYVHQIGPTRRGSSASTSAR